MSLNVDSLDPAIIAGAQYVLESSVAWAFYRLQARNTVAGNIATIDAYIGAKSK